MKHTLYAIVIVLFLANPIYAQLDRILTGAEQTELYIPKISHKKIAVVANHSSIIGKVYLVDSLISLKIKIKKIFAPNMAFVARVMQENSLGTTPIKKLAYQLYRFMEATKNHWLKI